MVALGEFVAGNAMKGERRDGIERSTGVHFSLE